MLQPTTNKLIWSRNTNEQNAVSYTFLKCFSLKPELKMHNGFSDISITRMYKLL